MDFFIPAKTNKDGRKFGFVRFRLRSFVGELLDSVNDIWIGSYKIRLKPGRFTRDDRIPTRVSHPQNAVPIRKYHIPEHNRRRDNTSYAEVIAGKASPDPLPSSCKGRPSPCPFLPFLLFAWSRKQNGYVIV